MAEYTKVIKLLMVSILNNNKFYNLFDHGDGSMHVEFGRVDLTRNKKEYPIGKWDSIYKSKTKKGYKDITEFAIEVEVNENNDGTVETVKIGDSRVERFFNKLNGYSKKSIERNYKISSAAVTQAMVDRAQEIIESLHTKAVLNTDTDEMNEILLDLFHTIPRKMRQVRDHLFEGFDNDDDLKESLELISNEQSTLDVLSNDVKMLAAQKKNEVGSPSVQEQNILDTLGLKIISATPEEERGLKKLMGGNARQFVEAFKIVNSRSQQKFDKHLTGVSNKYTLEMFHGSRNENWLNIINTGLVIRPTGAVHTGSMFGDGIYGADDADKSIGYCSTRGSRWANGNDDEALLGIFDFHLGNQYHTANSDSRLSKAKLKSLGNYDSTFGHKGGGKYGGYLRKNEFIVYDADQVTIKYLIRIKS